MKRLLVCALLAGCASTGIHVGPAVRSFPTGVLPGAVDGLSVRAEPSAQAVFAAVGSSSTVWHGQLWSLRDGPAVLASLQVAQLKAGLATTSEQVRAGIRAAIGNGHYRWFKVGGTQWVGVQEEGDVSLYLWFPRRSDLFAVAQVSAKRADPQSLVGSLVASTQEALS